jgi:heptaprenyl diphosphate synthase
LHKRLQAKIDVSRGSSLQFWSFAMLVQGFFMRDMNTRSLLLETTAQDHHIARMAAVALGLTILENAIPSPLPGVKPGLANIVTLIVLARYGWLVAAWVSLLRVVAGSLLFGNFLAPGFFLSLSGALLSLIVLAFAQHLPARWFGPVSHSIYAAFGHITGQMLVVYMWLVPHAGIAYLIPIFATAALVFGTVNGLIAARFMDNTETVKPHMIENPT